MKIRSITTFYDPALNPPDPTLDRLALFAQEAEAACKKQGLAVQSLRLATSPFPAWAPSLQEADMASLAFDFERQANESGFSYLSLGTALPETPTSFAPIPAILAATRSVFVTGSMTGDHGKVSLNAVKACGEIVSKAATITPDGFTNLRFAALGNVPAGSPFLPSAYHTPGTSPTVALAVECADVVLDVFSQAETLANARQELLGRLEGVSHEMQNALSGACDRYGIRFLGIDFSPAPYPSMECSSGAALEALGLSRLGLSGTLAASAFLADTLDRGNWPRAGFNGLMLPVLEDVTLSARAADGSLTVKDLLMVSAVCGTGLDTIPLPGDATPAQLSALLFDVAVMSQRLDKPLTARLMPIPGKAAGDPTDFDFEFFSNSRVMALPAEPLHGLFAGDEWIDLHPRSSYR